MALIHSTSSRPTGFSPSRELRSSFEKRAQEPQAQATQEPAQPRVTRDGFEDLSNYSPSGMPSLDGSSQQKSPYSVKLDSKQYAPSERHSGSITTNGESVTAQYEQRAGDRKLGMSIDTEKGVGQVSYGQKLGAGEFSVKYGSDGQWEVEGKAPVGMIGGVPVTAQAKVANDMVELGLGAELERGVVNAEGNVTGSWKQGDGFDLNGMIQAGLKLGESLGLKGKLDLNYDLDQGTLTLGASAEAHAGAFQAKPEGSWTFRMWDPEMVEGGALQEGFGPATAPATGLPEVTASGMRVGGAAQGLWDDFGMGPQGLVPGGASQQTFIDMGAGPQAGAGAPPTANGMMLGGAPEALRPYEGFDFLDFDAGAPASPTDGSSTTGEAVTSTGSMRAGDMLGDLGTLGSMIDAGAEEPADDSSFGSQGLSVGGGWASDTVSTPSFGGGLTDLGGGLDTSSFDSLSDTSSDSLSDTTSDVSSVGGIY